MTQRLAQHRKKFIIERDGGICQYCGKPDDAMTVDHVIPRSKGGTNHPDNLVAACGPCNGIKADRTPEDAGMTLITNRGKQRTIILVKGAEYFGDTH